MCTVMAYRACDTVVGRNLDLERSLGEALMLLPRRAPFSYRCARTPKTAYAVMGMACQPHEQPLFFDALNEKGVYMAALNFPLWASYMPSESDGAVAPFELIPFVLRQCAAAREAADILRRTTVAAMAYDEAWPLTPLHWFVCDEAESFAVEPLADGLHIEPADADVLTNSPPLSYHRIRLADFTAISPADPPEMFGSLPTAVYSRGAGTVGLPGDWSSSARFVRAAYMLQHAPWLSPVGAMRDHTMQMLSCVSFPKGCVRVGEADEFTVYSSCAALRAGTYSFTTYHDRRVRTVSLADVDTDGQNVSKIL